MFISRIESLVLGAGLSDALNRAEAYLEAGSDGILIHSVAQDASEVGAFTERLRRNGCGAPVFVVPTTYSHVHCGELVDFGINAVIYANQLLRAAYPAMKRVAEAILYTGRVDTEAMGVELASIRDILELVPEVSTT